MKSSRPALRKLAAEAGLSIGCHPDWQDRGETWGPVYLLQREFDTLVSNAFHWRALQPEGPGKWDWSQADLAVQLAHEIGLNLRGHAILWYQMIPPWFAKLESRRAKEHHLLKHISTLVKRYRGKIVSWDVLNEPLWLPHGLAGGIRRDPFFECFGAEYVDLAFHAAAEADPGAELVLNEALLVHEHQAAQRSAFLGLLESLVGRGVPVHTAGIQAHIGWDDDLPMGALDPSASGELLRQIGDLHLASKITELDVFDAGLPADPSHRDRLVADLYARFLEGILGEDSLLGIYFWGCGDQNSWYDTYVRRVMSDRLPSSDWHSRPLLFDLNYRPKPSYFAIARALRKAALQSSDQVPRSNIATLTA